jgi:hypothetical protein
MMLGGTGNAIAKQIFANLQYDPLVDLMPIAMLGIAPSVLLVSSSLPVDDVRGLVAMGEMVENAARGESEFQALSIRPVRGSKPDGQRAARREGAQTGRAPRASCRGRRAGRLGR